LWSNEEWHADLLSLGSRGVDDIFFQWVYDTAIYWYHQILGRHIKVGQAAGSQGLNGF